MWFLTADPAVGKPMILKELPEREKTAGVSPRIIAVTNKSNSVTKTMASSLVAKSCATKTFR